MGLERTVAIPKELKWIAKGLNSLDQIRSHQITSGGPGQGSRANEVHILAQRGLRSHRASTKFGFQFVACYCFEEEAKRYRDTLADQRQVKAETSEKWYHPLVTTTNEKWMRENEERCREGRRWEWCVENIVMWNSSGKIMKIIKEKSQ